jgi:hypothetical protein
MTLSFKQFLTEAVSNDATVALTFRFSIPDDSELYHGFEVPAASIMKQVGEKLGQIIDQSIQVRKVADAHAKRRWVLEPADKDGKGLNLDLVTPAMPVAAAVPWIAKIDNLISLRLT